MKEIPINHLWLVLYIKNAEHAREVTTYFLRSLMKGGLALGESTSSTGLRWQRKLEHSTTERLGFLGDGDSNSQKHLRCSSCHSQSPTDCPLQEAGPLLIGLSGKAHWEVDIFTELIFWGKPFVLSSERRACSTEQHKWSRTRWIIISCGSGSLRKTALLGVKIKQWQTNWTVNDNSNRLVNVMERWLNEQLTVRLPAFFFFAYKSLPQCDRDGGNLETYHTKSLQTEQKVGWLKKMAVNSWLLTTWTLSCLIAPLLLFSVVTPSSGITVTDSLLDPAGRKVRQQDTKVCFRAALLWSDFALYWWHHGFEVTVFTDFTQIFAHKYNFQSLWRKHGSV